MKKVLLVVVYLLCFLSLFAGESLISEATNGMFKNLNDYVSKPNKAFNTFSNDALIISSSFSSSSISSSENTSGGAQFGYYRHGKIPFSIMGSFSLLSNKHIKSQTTVTSNKTVITEYSSPLVDNFDFSLSGILGLPFFMDSSFGFTLHMFGNGNNKYKTITTTKDNNGNVIGSPEEIINKNSLLKTELSIPLFLKINEDFSNYLNASLYFSSYNTEITNTTGEVDKNHYGSFSMFFYDKFTMFSLIPNGKETNIWLSMGNNPTLSKESEIVPYTQDESKFSFQVGLSNSIDFSPVKEVQILLNPKFYLDMAFSENSSFSLALTLSCDIALYADFSGGAFSFFFGFTPRLSYYFQKDVQIHTSSTSTFEEVYSEGKLLTDILWSGKLGVSMKLPKDMTCVLTLNVNDMSRLIYISAQLNIQL